LPLKNDFPAGAPRLLLHVEDDPDGRFLLERALSRHGPAGWEYHGLPHGEAALEYLAQTTTGSARRPALVVLDVNMPGIDGFGVLEWITENMPDLAAVMLSSSEMLSDQLRARDLGSRGYFVKSATFSDFLEFLCGWHSSPMAHEMTGASVMIQPPIGVSSNP
jgi:CheY-like chemotaxis protein